jgi:hypothetical protein
LEFFALHPANSKNNGVGMQTNSRESPPLAMNAGGLSADFADWREKNGVRLAVLTALECFLSTSSRSEKIFQERGQPCPRVSLEMTTARGQSCPRSFGCGFGVRGHVRPFERLIYLLAGCNLSRLQKGFNEFAFAANDQAGKFLEPFAFRRFGFGAKPVRHKFELFGGNFSFTGAVKQVIQQMGRKTLSANARHGYSP